jgi:hypothetical protein
MRHLIFIAGGIASIDLVVPSVPSTDPMAIIANYALLSLVKADKVLRTRMMNMVF